MTGSIQGDYTIKTGGISETKKIAAELAKTLKGGELILLEGDLGAGKTAFCSGIFEALGCNGHCSSPTFSIVNIYDSNPTFAHMDLYRINEKELEQTGIFDLLYDGAVVAVEWASNAPSLIKDADIIVNIKIIDENSREITIRRL